jgi:hypothetical protein
MGSKKPVSFLLSSLLLCQMFGGLQTAVCADKKVLADVTVETDRGWSEQSSRFASGSREKLSERPALLALGDFSDCDPAFSSFSDHADNSLQRDPVGGQRCVAGIGANHVTYGKLTTRQFPASRDVWMSGSVYFNAGFDLPQQQIGRKGMCYMGVHLWRLNDSIPSKRIQIDLNIPAGMDTFQLLLFQYEEGSPRIKREFVKYTSFRPASPRLQGKWQYWQVHANLGTPGKSDGFLRFYVDGKLVDSMEKQPFLPPGADDQWGLSYADMQSNISAGCGDQKWPRQNGWLISDVRVCKNGPC